MDASDPRTGTEIGSEERNLDELDEAMNNIQHSESDADHRSLETKSESFSGQDGIVYENPSSNTQISVGKQAMETEMADFNSKASDVSGDKAGKSANDQEPLSDIEDKVNNLETKPYNYSDEQPGTPLADEYTPQASPPLDDTNQNVAQAESTLPEPDADAESNKIDERFVPETEDFSPNDIFQSDDPPLDDEEVSLPDLQDNSDSHVINSEAKDDLSTESSLERSNDIVAKDKIDSPLSEQSPESPPCEQPVEDQDLHNETEFKADEQEDMHVPTDGSGDARPVTSVTDECLTDEVQSPVDKAEIAVAGSESNEDLLDEDINPVEATSQVTAEEDDLLKEGDSTSDSQDQNQAQVTSSLLSETMVSGEAKDSIEESSETMDASDPTEAKITEDVSVQQDSTALDEPSEITDALENAETNETDDILLQQEPTALKEPSETKDTLENTETKETEDILLQQESSTPKESSETMDALATDDVSMQGDTAALEEPSESMDNAEAKTAEEISAPDDTAALEGSDRIVENESAQNSNEAMETEDVASATDKDTSTVSDDTEPRSERTEIDKVSETQMEVDAPETDPLNTAAGNSEIAANNVDTSPDDCTDKPSDVQENINADTTSDALGNNSETIADELPRLDYPVPIAASTSVQPMDTVTVNVNGEEGQISLESNIIDITNNEVDVNNAVSAVMAVKTEVEITEDIKQQVVGQESSKSPSESDQPPTKQKTESDTGKDDKKSKSSQMCIVCRNVQKCKYNIVRNGDIKHLCDDLCFKRFRANPATFLTKKPSHNDKDRKAVAAAAAAADKCMQCRIVLTTAISLTVNDKQFCGTTCSKAFNAKNSAEDDIQIVGTSTVAKDKAATSTHGNKAAYKCAVCHKYKPAKHDILLAKTVHKLCSDSCQSSFRFANKIQAPTCDSCGKSIVTENSSNTVQYDGVLRKFCTTLCMNTYKTKRQRLVTCTWCQNKKSNFDMVERVDGQKIQLFCSLNCLSLYRVNLQATSNQKVTCDHCHKFAPAQYHLTMSDASVRNFCSYNCVMGFQAQFQQPQTPSAGRGSAPQISAGHGAGRGRGTPQPTSQPAGRGRGRPPTRHSQRAKSTTPVTPPPLGAAVTPNSMPLISQVVSLAERDTASPVHIQKSSSVPPPPAISSSPALQPAPEQVSISTQVLIQPPEPVTTRNKMLLCKPATQTKATSCRPHAITEGTQTEEDFVAKPALIPVPIPIYVPIPMAMYSIPVPYPIPLPIPIPVPCFIPTTRKSADGILKQIKKIRDTVPDDPFEAELLMMAEAVAGHKDVSSSSDEDNGGAFGADDIDDVPTPAPVAATAAAPDTGAYAEDMLQMALRMASAIPDDTAMDLESQLQATPVNPNAQQPQPYNPMVENTAPPPPPVMQQLEPRKPKAAAKRRSASSRSSKSKKIKVEEQPPVLKQEPINIQPQEAPADANMVLKFTYGVNAWKHWVIGKNNLLESQAVSNKSRAKPRLYKTDVLACTPDELNFALCQFVKEVRKPNGEEYAPDSIYYLTLGIQEYLFENGRIDNIFTDIYYERFTECLNDVLSHYEVRLNQQGLIVCRIEEEHLWESKQLGAHSPHVLLNTLVYFNTKQFMLRSVEEHLRLSFSHIMKHWKKTNAIGGKPPGRSVYLRYYAPAAQDGNRNKRREDQQPSFEQAENLDNPLRCPVKLYEFYLSKCPESIKNRNDVFYLMPERSCVPDSPVWYSTGNLGAEHMSKMLNRLRVVKEIQEAQLHMQPYGAPAQY